MTLAYIGAGANLGDARQTLKDAIVCLAQRPGVTIIGRSCLYRSAPVEASGDDYLNAVVSVETALSARQLLQICRQIEDHFGRERPFRNAPRTLDLDILLFGDELIADEDLQVPHPRIAGRAFVLLPLTELSPEVEIPGLGLARALLPAVAGQRIEKVQSCHCPCPSFAHSSPSPTR